MSQPLPVNAPALNWRTLMKTLDVIAVDEGKRTRNGAPQRVERFTLGRLTHRQLEWLRSFSNVEISKATYRYAPEITHPVVYLYQ